MNGARNMKATDSGELFWVIFLAVSVALHPSLAREVFIAWLVLLVLGCFFALLGKLLDGVLWLGDYFDERLNHWPSRIGRGAIFAFRVAVGALLIGSLVWAFIGPAVVSAVTWLLS